MICYISHGLHQANLAGGEVLMYATSRFSTSVIYQCLGKFHCQPDITSASAVCVELQRGNQLNASHQRKQKVMGHHSHDFLYWCYVCHRNFYLNFIIFVVKVNLYEIILFCYLHRPYYLMTGRLVIGNQGLRHLFSLELCFT